MSIVIARKILTLFALIWASGCVLGPQPEPPDVTDGDEARFAPDMNFEPDTGGYADMGDDGSSYREPGPCEEGLAGGEWNCEGDGDRDGHDLCDIDELEAENTYTVSAYEITDFLDPEGEPEPTDIIYTDDDGDEEGDDDDEDDEYVDVVAY